VNRTDLPLLDASTWIAARDPEDRFQAAARALVLDTALPVAALDLTLYEIANVMGARRRQLREARHLLGLVRSRCADRIVHHDASMLESAMEVAVEHGLTAYDAAYVAAARRHRWTLVSCDVADLVSKGLAVTPDDADYP
jgi:predicted nucleic acid-binding protein